MVELKAEADRAENYAFIPFIVRLASRDLEQLQVTVANSDATTCFSEKVKVGASCTNQCPKFRCHSA